MIDPVNLHAHKAALRDAELKAAHPDYEFSDVGLGRSLLDRHGHRLRYCYDWRKWIVWNKRCWAPDETGELERLAKMVLDEAILEALLESEQKTRERRVVGFVKCMRENRIKPTIDLARSESGVPVKASELDADQWLLNVGNGTVDTRTGELREHRQADLLTKLAGTDYEQAAECPRFLAFMDRIFAGNQDLISFVQRSFGYALTGSTRERVIFVFYGTGDNGKSTLINIVLEVLGGYATQAAPDVLLLKRRDEHPAAIADLEGKRLVAAIETEQGHRLAECLVKQLAGGDRVKSRGMYEKYRELKWVAKLVLACNHKPVIRGTDHAIWRRIKLVPFNVTIPPKDMDLDLPEKLRAERPGILRWLIDGSVGWQIHGLGEPKEVTDATREYRADSDVLAAFLKAECILSPGASVSKKALRAAYSEWCGQNGYKPTTSAALREELVARGITEDRDNQARFWTGIGLTEDFNQ